jgi:HK97 family phage major capsid protein
MAARMIELNADKDRIGGELDALCEAAAKDKRVFTEQEQTKADELEASLELVMATIKHEQLRLERERGSKRDEDTGRRSNASSQAEGANPWGDISDPNDEGAFLQAFGSFLQAVATAKIKGDVDPRLLPKAAASGMNTSVPSEGGALVRTDFSTRLLERAEEQAVLLPKCSRIPIGEGFDGLEAPYIDETSRATGSRWGGVQVFRRAEADTVNATKPKVGTLEIRLEDLMGIAYATGRSLQDAPALAALIMKSFASEFAFKVDDEIFRGTGVGQMLGIYPGGVAGPYVAVQAAEGGQTVDTVNAANVQKMFAHMPTRLMPGAEWLIGNEVWPQLFAMNQANMPVFMPGTSMANAPYGMLLGRPITPIEQASAIGDVGDVSLVNLGEYLVIEKGGIQTAESMHVRFIYDEMTFRFIYRINGKPSWKTKLTPYKGAFDLSPFVGLAAR